jgi:ABC-type transporter Mla MlaB component
LPEPSAQRTATTVEVTGPVTRAEVALWRTAFVEALSRGGGLCIDLAGSGPWDAAGVQLLLATIESGRRAGRTVCLTRVPNVLTALAQRAALGERLAEITVAQARGAGSLP